MDRGIRKSLISRRKFTAGANEWLDMVRAVRARERVLLTPVRDPKCPRHLSERHERDNIVLQMVLGTRIFGRHSHLFENRRGPHGASSSSSNTAQSQKVKFKLKKYSLLAERTDYLGHDICPGSLKIATTTTSAIKELIYPCDQTELRSFLGLYNLFSRFVPDFRQVAAPFNKKLRKDHSV